MTKRIQLQGHLNLELNQMPIYLRAENDHIQIEFTSLRSLKKFLFFFRERVLHTRFFNFFNEKGGDHLKFSYYLASYLIAESGPHIKKESWLSSYFGIKNLQIHKKNLFQYLLSN